MMEILYLLGVACVIVAIAMLIHIMNRLDDIETWVLRLLTDIDAGPPPLNGDNNREMDSVDMPRSLPSVPPKLRRRPGRKARRFTDKSREWMAARETASRR